MFQHTIAIFQNITGNLPPFFPSERAEEMTLALKELRENSETNVESVEKIMVKYGYELWPWQRAFSFFLQKVENRLAETFLLSRLSENLEKSFRKYRDYGLTWRELFSGRAAAYFTPEERAELTPVLSETRRNLLHFTTQEIASTTKKEYLNQVKANQQTIVKVKEILDNLRDLAEETEHVFLVGEIHQKIRHIEHGLCHLAPLSAVDEAFLALDFFKERRAHLNILRGIDKALDIKKHD